MRTKNKDARGGRWAPSWTSIKLQLERLTHAIFIITPAKMCATIFEFTVYTVYANDITKNVREKIGEIDLYRDNDGNSKQRMRVRKSRGKNGSKTEREEEKKENGNWWHRTMNHFMSSCINRTKCTTLIQSAIISFIICRPRARVYNTTKSSLRAQRQKCFLIIYHRTTMHKNCVMVECHNTSDHE